MWRQALVGLILLGSTAHAEKPRTTMTAVQAKAGTLGTPHVVFLNRCAGGCVVHSGEDSDARTHTSPIPPPGDHVISEFPWGDAEWDAVVSCLKDVWSPYNITLTETRPTSSDWGEAIIAGSPGQISLPAGIGGVAPIDQFCRSLNHPITFTFAEVLDDPDRVHLICAVASQEMAHAYGLDHTYSFLDGSSSCSDPMTYRDDCGGQSFFRNHVAKCGEYEPRGCRCGASQNSHVLLTGLLGLGTPTTTTTVSIASPTDGPIGDGITIVAPAFGDRGLTEVVFRLNGYPWSRQPGAPFGPDGQPATDYRFALPLDVPDGVIDIEVEARDDLGVTSVARVTVTKGVPCVGAETCADGQNCDAGRCIWDPPSGEVGDACSYPQFCLNERCDTHDGASFCTRTCLPDVADSCAPGLECASEGDEHYCWPISNAGCCSTTRGVPWGTWVIGAIVIGLARRRSNRRKGR
jgi:hypothetical protein